MSDLPPPPPGPPPSSPPPSSPPPSSPPSHPPARGRRPWLLLAAAVVGGLVVGVLGTLAGGALLGGDPDDVDRACAIVDDIDDDAFTGGSDEAFDDVEDLFRSSAAADLFLAANDGEFEGELGELALGLQRGAQTFDGEQARTGLADARTYCDGR